MYKINMGNVLSNRAFLSPDLEASVGDTYRYTYKEVNDRANRFARYLETKGINKGDRIAILCKNNEHVTTSLFGAAKAGVVTVMLNWRLQPAELSYILNDCEAGLIVYDEEYQEMISEMEKSIPAKTFIKWSPEDGGDFEAIIKNAKAGGERIGTGWDDDPAVIMYTSGTTGKPKGATLSHKNLYWASIGLAHTIDWGFKYRFLSIAPLFHIGGLAPIMANVHSGCTTVYVPNFDPAKTWDVMESERIDFMMSVPLMLQFMLMVPGIDKKNLPSLKYIVCGGSMVSKELIDMYAAYNIDVYQVYGITEYSGAVSFWTPDMGLDKSHSMGKPVFHGEVKIFRPGTEEVLLPNEVGEICCFGPQVFSGYWNNSEATEESIKNGYYRSGDLGMKDEEGFVYVVDRLKDMIISGGENIYPAEIETALKTMPGIAEISVIGGKDDKWGEIPVAFVVKNGDPDINEADIINTCKKNLAAYKCIKEVKFVQAIPKNAVGKVLKKELRKDYR